MALIFLPALALLPLVSLIATVIPGSSLTFISVGNYFFIEIMLLLIVEIVAFGFNKNLNGKSIRKRFAGGRNDGAYTSQFIVRLRFLGSHTPEYAPRRKASPFATCSHLHRHFSGITGVCL